jgi:glycogen(starch) synthase
VRIVHVTHRAWPVVGGSERYVLEVARRQVLEGHRATIVATDAADLTALWDRRGARMGPDAPGECDGVRIRRLPVRCLPLGRVVFPALRWLTWLTSQFSVRAALPLMRFSPRVPRLCQVLGDEGADLLFAWNITLEGLTAAVAQQAALRGVPWVAVPLLHLGRRRFYTMRHQFELLRGADLVLAQTPTEQAYMLERGFDGGCVRIVSPGVDPAAAARADGARFRRKHGLDGPVVLSVGALGFEKGTPHLLAAARRLWREGRRLTVVLIGPGEAGVARALARLPGPERALCRYLGEVPEEEKWDAVGAADVIAMPSRTESFGIVFLEAWACGKPVIAARTGAVPDVVRDGDDGLLVEFGDAGGLARALRRLLDDRETAAALGRRGRAKVFGEYTWDHQYARMRAIVDEVGSKWEE